MQDLIIYQGLIFGIFFTISKKRLVEIENLNTSRRCNKQICDFANDVYFTENNMVSGNNEKTIHDGVFILKNDMYDEYCSHYNCQTLRYDKKTQGHFINPLNFGCSKGITFDRTAIIANKTFEDFLKGKKLKSPEKYYVGVTRAKYSICIFVKDTNNIKNCNTISLDLNGKKVQC